MAPTAQTLALVYTPPGGAPIPLVSFTFIAGLLTNIVPTPTSMNSNVTLVIPLSGEITTGAERFLG